MNKSDLIMELASSNQINLKDAEAVVDAFFNTIVDGLCRGERAEIRGFGSFSVRSYHGYTGRNPKSGQAIEVRSKKMPVFKPGKLLRILVNPNGYEPDFEED
ncbi:MAG: integration host factor subunit beta [Deltaproteobacteria bacterium]|nr:integration host factor subunit beta [Deltaproteobacteria bacterium]